MKKTYQTPSVHIMNVNSTQMLALSVNTYNTGAEDDLVLTRRYEEEYEDDFWGEDLETDLDEIW